MSIKISHVGIAVNNLEESLRFYREVLGIKEKGIEENLGEGMKVAFVGVGESNLEIMEPRREDSAIGKHIAKRGEGIQHLAIHVDDIQAALQKAKEAGFKLIDEQPRQGAGGTLIAFIHPKSTSGVLLELCQGEPQH